MNLQKYKEVLIKVLGNIFPNNRDNIKQIAIKCLYIVSVLAVAVSGICLGNYFTAAKGEEKLLNEYQSLWKDNKIEELNNKNSDFKGWLSMEGTDIDHPIFQCDDNSYYLSHSADNKKSEKGSLCFDYRNKIKENEYDSNLIIYGNDNKDSSVFGNLKKLRNIGFFKQHSTLKLSLLDSTDTYKIYAVFVLNSKKEDDGGYIYNLYRKNFLNETDFSNWIDEAKKRSVINSNVEVDYGDSILTLITGCDDFDDARLVVMAKKIDSSEKADFETAHAYANHKPLYPEKWYTERGLKK